MNDDLEKTPGLNYSETFVLTYFRFSTYIVLIFSDLNKAQFYKIPYRNSPHQEYELPMSFHYLQLIRPIEHSGEYHIRKPNDETFLFEMKDKIYIHVGEKLFSFETNDEKEKFSSEHAFNDVKFLFADGKENIYFMLHQKDTPLQEYESSTVKIESRYLYKKDENEDIVEFGKEFLNCKIIQSKQ